MIKRADGPIVWYDAHRIDPAAIDQIRGDRPRLSFVPVHGPPDRVVGSISLEPWPTPDELFRWASTVEHLRPTCPTCDRGDTHFCRVGLNEHRRGLS